MVELFEDGVVGFDWFMGGVKAEEGAEKIKKLCVSAVDLSQ